jgi:hypothetical protein
LQNNKNSMRSWICKRWCVFWNITPSFTLFCTSFCCFMLLPAYTNQGWLFHHKCLTYVPTIFDNTFNEEVKNHMFVLVLFEQWFTIYECIYKYFIYMK